MAEKYVPDGLDRKIIAHLRADARAPLAKLASALGIARGTAQSRLDRLLETGALLGFTVRIRDDYEDRAVRAIMMILSGLDRRVGPAFRRSSS